jgi:LPS-assembly protein
MAEGAIARRRRAVAEAEAARLGQARSRRLALLTSLAAGALLAMLPLQIDAQTRLGTGEAPPGALDGNLDGSLGSSLGGNSLGGGAMGDPLLSPGLPGGGLPANVTPAPAPGSAAAQDQLSRLQGGTDNRDQPVTFTADEVEYDQANGIVRARGKIEAWQGQRILRADAMEYNRNTGVAIATGHVEMLEPDGQTLFADRVELTGNMRDGVIEGIRGLLSQNGRLVAAGARRTNGTILDMARAIYSACDLCAANPEKAPLWQLRARQATQDKEAQRIRYYDASVQFYGVPVLYTPYLSMPDPSVPRQSGFLSPSFGTTTFLGAFIETPYYWAIDDSSDLTVTPLLSTEQVPNLGLAYRKRFNFGEVSAVGSLGYFDGNDTNGEKGLVGHIFARGRFNIDENWRTGFDLNRASSQTYLRAYRFGSARQLPSSAFVEGFWGTEAYARIDGRVYQGLRSQDDVALIPVVLPNLYMDYAARPDALGGSWTMDAGGFAIHRDKGTNTRRLASRLSYELPKTDAMGNLWTIRAQGDALGHWADKLDLAPNYASGIQSATEATLNARVAVDWRNPLVRRLESGSVQTIEPRVQLVTGPSTGRQTRIPNEDSLDLEFTDANLFDLNRFSGRDRQEGGTRVDAAMRGAWTFPSGGEVEGLVGRSFRMATDDVFYQGSGLEGRSSDWVGRVRVSPVSWLDLVTRGRWDKETLDRRLIDTSAHVSMGPVQVTAGYLYTTPSPVLSPQRTRREVSGSVSAKVTQFWRVGGYGRYDIDIDRPVWAGVNATYEDECFIFDARFSKIWAEESTSLAAYPSSTLLLFRVGLKTVGDFGFRAI